MARKKVDVMNLPKDPQLLLERIEEAARVPKEITLSEACLSQGSRSDCVDPREIRSKAGFRLFILAGILRLRTALSVRPMGACSQNVFYLTDTCKENAQIAS